MKTKILLLFSAIFLSMSLQAQNEIDFVNPPTSVQAGTTVTFNVQYTKAAEITKGYALVRFKTPGPDSENLEQGFTLVDTVDSGTVTVECVAPLTEGVGYIIETQLFDARESSWVTLDTKDRVGITVTSPPNYIKLLDAPTELVAGSTVTLDYELKNSVSAGTNAYVKLVNASNGVIFDSGALAVSAPLGTVTTNSVDVTIPSATPANDTNKFQLFFYEQGVWTAQYGFNLVNNITILPDPNDVTLVDPPNRLIINSSTDIDVDYIKDPAIASATVKLILKDSEGAVVNEATTIVTDASGTVTLSIQAPAALATGYSLVTELLDGSTVKATDLKEGISIDEESAFSLTMVNPPTAVAKDSSVDIVVNYTKDDAAAFITLQFTDGNNTTSSAPFVVPDNEGSTTISVPTPSVIGTGYNLEAKLFSASAVVHKTQIVENVIVDNAEPNSVTLINPKTAVTGGENVSFTFDFSKSLAVQRGHVFIRFKDAAGLELETASAYVTAASGTNSELSITIPGDASGDGYSYQIQMFDPDNGYAFLAQKNVTDVTVEAYVPTGENTLEITGISSDDPINNGDIRTVSVAYNTLEASNILVEIHSVESPVNGDTKIGQTIITLPAGNNTLEVELPVNLGHPGDKNKIQALLFKADWSASISIPQIPSLVLDGGDGTITYIGQDNVGLGESLGEGYYSNYYIAEGWKGPLKTNFGPYGSPSWIEYTNENVVADGHKEFDIKIQKFSWHQYKDTSVDRGYPRKISDIAYPINTSLEGQWSEGSGGKGQINMTAWITKDGEMTGEGSERSDIIVHAFDNGGNFRQKYDDNTVSGDHTFNNLGEITSGGVVYQVLRTLPGYLGEVASYNLVPDAIVQADPTANYTTAVITANIDMKDIIDQLITKEAGYAGTQVAINSNWQINGLEWTVVGQSPDASSGFTKTTVETGIPAGHGKFTFNSYVIPDLTDVGLLSTENVESKFQNLAIYPNPFADSFTYKFDRQSDEEVIVELFTITGRKIKTIKKSTLANSGTVITGALSKGMYLVRITSGDLQETKTLVKN